MQNLSYTNKKKIDLMKDELDFKNQIIKNITEGIVIVRESNGIIVFTNPAFDQIFGYEKGELIGQNIEIVNAPTEKTAKDVKNEIIDTVVSSGEWHGEIQNMKKTKEIIWCYANVSQFFHPNYGNVIVSVQTDISNRKLIEKALIREKKQIEQLAKYPSENPSPVLRISSIGNIIYSNKASEILLNSIKNPQNSLVKKEILQKIQQSISQNVQVQFEIVVENLTFLLNLAPLQKEKVVLVYGLDITNQKQTEKDKLRGLKIESISLLAGGIAHDFNNLLTGILGNTNLLEMDEKLGAESKEILQEVEKSVKRANALTKQLLTFSKGGTPIKNTESIIEILKESATFILRGSKSNYMLDIKSEIPPVEVDIGQINQVINNLLLNAEQSMAQGGTIKIVVDTILATESHHINRDEGKYIRIRIKDQGIGIPLSDHNKIFNPYFSTKERGNGLGLATCYSIITNHGGFINFTSEVNMGTEFIIYLPASHNEYENSHQNSINGIKYDGSVLIIDDDEVILMLLRKMLRKLGFTVDIAKTGYEGVELYRSKMQSNHKFKFLICDLTIPGDIGGQEAMTKILEMDPKGKGIVSSGYSNDLVMANFMKYGFKGILNKPYTFKQLEEVVSNILNK